MSQLLLAKSYEFDASVITNGILQCENGDYVLAGRIFNKDSDSSAFAMRVMANGMELWRNVYSSPFTQFFQAITQKSESKFIATGSFFYSEYEGDEYLWVVELDEEGNIVWEKTFGNVGEQSDGYDVIATADGGFIIVGISIESDPLTWVLKFDVDNNLQWSKKYDIGIAHSITQTKDGGYALSGAIDFDESLNSKVFVLRLDENGNELWNVINEDNLVYILLNSNIIETANGHFAIVAKSVIMEVNSCGCILWSTQSENLNLNSILQDNDGNYSVSGALIVSYFDHSYLAVISKTGEKILWDNTEILYNSSILQSIINNDGFITSCGYAPCGANKLQTILAVFNHVESTK